MKTASIEGLLALTYWTNYDIKRIYDLVENHGALDTVIIDELHGTSKAIGETIDGLEAHAMNVLAQLEYYNIETIPYYSEKYPKCLNALKDKPPLLFVRGELLEKSMVAVIGTRNSSKYGEWATKNIVERVVNSGYGVVSGLAVGIDTLAHASTIFNSGYTVAVMPNPLDTIYPKENFGLACSILDSGGALVSELAPGINRGKQSFILRNRLQAAFAWAVIPVEMGVKSGSMHTINFAKRLGKVLILVHPPERAKVYPTLDGIFHLINEARVNQTESSLVATDWETLEQALIHPETKAIRRDLLVSYLGLANSQLELFAANQSDLPMEKPQKNKRTKRQSKPSN